MKFKISWPTGIILALSAFIIFILSFVYKATFMSQYDHHLVSDDYYKDEMNYQQEINKLNKAAALKEDVRLSKVSDGLLVKFPTEFDAEKITGTISFQRPSNDKIDFQLPIKLIASDYLISKENLVEGRWNVKIEWTINGITYLFKEKLMY
ncbi:MAG: FixH family protein [Lutibacter sp.]|nr:FixH family protein [Lutibacter sp.]